MHKKFIYIILSVVVIVAFLLFYLFYSSSTKSYSNNTVYNAINSRTPIIISINNYTPINNKSIGYITLKEAGLLSQIDMTFNVLKSITENEENLQFLKKKQLTITLNYEGKNELRSLYLLPLNNKQEETFVLAQITKLLENVQLKTNVRKYSNTTIREYHLKSGERLFISSHNGILMLSRKGLLIEDAIRQLDTKTSENNKAFDNIIKTASSQADMNIFIQHGEIERLLSMPASSIYQGLIAQTKTYSKWTEFDINFKNNKLISSGFTIGSAGGNFYSTVLAKQKSGSINIESILPAETPFFTAMHISDIKNYFIDYEAFLQKRNLFFQREQELKKIESVSKVKIDALLNEIFANEIALAGINIDPGKSENGRVFIIETTSSSYAKNSIAELTKNYIESRNISNEGWNKVYKIDAETTFEISRFPYSNLPKILFGQIFNGIKSNWFFTYENYLVFADSYETATTFIHANVLGETIGRELTYNKFKSNLTSKSNFYFYCNTSVASTYSDLIFNDKIASQIQDNSNLRKFRKLGFQISSAETMLYNNLCFEFNEETATKPQTIWRSHLDTKANFKPQFVINHYDQLKKEIVVQDEKNNFYLINNVGRILWKVQLDGKIKSNVFQIDYFKNGKLQYLLNTSKKLYMIDRNGNNVTGFPVQFRADATNGVNVFDYDNNKSYRFFVACNNKKIYAYDHTGKLLRGWNKFSTEHIIQQPVQHFRVDGKDYIVASDEMKDYILNRQGKIRVKTNTIYQHSPNNQLQLEIRTSNTLPRMVTTDIEGNLHYTYFDGKHEQVKLSSAGKQHFFVAQNLDDDSEIEYILCENNTLQIFDSNLKSINKTKLNQPITLKPNVYSFSASTKKIGLVSEVANKIYLIDIHGKQHSGFPLEGASEFSIGFINNESTNFNLLVCSHDGYLYNYFVE